jgi:hypothetical protein
MPVSPDAPVTCYLADVVACPRTYSIVVELSLAPQVIIFEPTTFKNFLAFGTSDHYDGLPV